MLGGHVEVRSKAGSSTEVQELSAACRGDNSIRTIKPTARGSRERAKGCNERTEFAATSKARRGNANLARNLRELSFRLFCGCAYA